MGTRASKLSRILRRRLTRGRSEAPVTPKGYIPVLVGVGSESKRFMVHTTSFKDAELLDLLGKWAEEYGYRNDGALRIPYDAKNFEERVIGRVGRRMLKVITP